MTAYTVILVLEGKPVQQRNPDDMSLIFVTEAETAASPQAALAAAITLQQSTWVAAQIAAYYPNGQPGGVAQFTAAMAPGVHAYIVLTGTTTIALSGQMAQAQPAGSDNGRF